MKILNKVKFSKNQNRMKSVGNVEDALNYYKTKKNKNLYFLTKNRYEWMNEYIKKEDKNIDAQDTKFASNSYDFIIASNMIHHIPYPIKFFKEIHRILKKDGKLIIQDACCSIIFQIITIIMRHEGYDFTKDVWSESTPVTDQNDLWAGNIAVPHLLFDDKNIFKENLGSYFSIEKENFSECFVFLNSGGVCSKTLYIPMNNFFLTLLSKIDYILVKLFPKIFAMGRQLVLRKK